MRKRIKMVTIILFAIFALMSIVSCGKKEVASKKVELSVLHYLDITSPEAKVEDEIFAEFAKAHPNITLNFEKLFGEAYHQKVKALAAAGDLTDVLYMWPGGRSAELTKNGLVQDLYPFLGDEKENFVSTAVAPQMDGKLYELPIAVTATHVMYANTKLLKELGLSIPKTYEELLAMVPVAKKAKVDLIIMPNKAAWVMQSCLFSTIVGRCAGEEWITSKDVSFEDKGFIKALSIVEELYAKGAFPASSIQLDYGDGPNLFSEGKGLFMIDGDWRVNALIPLLSEDKQKDIELTVFPQIAGQVGPNSSTSIVPATGFGMNAKLKDEKAQAAWELIHFFAGPVAAKIRLEKQGVIPAYKIDMSNVEISVLAKKRGEFYKNHSGTPVLDNVFSGKVIEVINTGLQKIALKDATPQQVAKEINKVASK